MVKKIVIASENENLQSRLYKDVLDFLQSRNVFVATVPSVLDTLNDNGFLTNKGCGIDIDAINLYLQNEKYLKKLADHQEMEVLLFNGGVIDAKRFYKGVMFDFALRLFGVNSLEQLDQYDLVFNIKGNYKEEKSYAYNAYYDEDEDDEYYKNFDKPTDAYAHVHFSEKTNAEKMATSIDVTNSWISHRNLQIIDASLEYEEIKNTVISILKEYLSTFKLADYHFLVDSKKAQEFLRSSDIKESETILVNDFYLSTKNNLKKLSGRNKSGDISYILTEEKAFKDQVIMVKDEAIDGEKASEILHYEDYELSKRNVCRFYYNGQLCTLSFYNDFCILDITPTPNHLNYSLPAMLINATKLDEKEYYDIIKSSGITRTRQKNN